ncbi:MULTISPECIES: hypothetical protein [unclassified Exiguobacterium]|uniref:hypothetical protein n=1 Tax=unclassified Exiguobacterium TaxID=2644629 RepID=UPI001BEA40B8|nr:MULTISPECIES: hypothetical protein [unclassified Exiguobacterium]
MKYVLTIQDDETLERLEKMNIVTYITNLSVDRIVFVRTDMTEDELLAIKGVKTCRASRVGKLSV